MDLMSKKRKWDMNALASEPMMYYGKWALITAGAFAVGRLSKRMMS